ncbi:lysophospholipid acyltransferase family protein [Sulfitobacter guttiformis]|uniref:KDO2-lipid IV(A) lauroyltransferase n=1 Tax=Sulfitobacter guttiformis TaxID=74349 RepID=A0A420DNZ6_9RHOB|nr:lysophospholipid acyltransferase family protein [Sulfitobacter guttiformis]KIN73326.1 Lipid A biosynthesis acyltransferase [Sulfitobacter guttiformis KCTC 32187]RKE95996.1 KDO2-lipid IV(A) lauroyltransferase [Sulfitobacter guttiformis]
MAKARAAYTLRYRLEYYLIRSMLFVMGILPFRQRSALMAWGMSRVVAPLVGYQKRVRDNLDRVWPEMDPAKRDALTLEINRNVGRTICELFSPRDLVSMAQKTAMTGAGLAALEAAQAANRPAIVISGHFGNYDIARARMIAEGFKVGALYRHMNNPIFHDFYLKNISTIGTPLFERGRPGLGQMVKHLKGGGTLAALIDVRANNGIPLPFCGHMALTATSMAELALRYDAVLIPFYGTRLPNGEGFAIDLEDPIPHSDPETMTQALNLSLEARVLQNPEQWFWIHNRWKGADQEQ